jgi:hypothetical protein
MVTRPVHHSSANFTNTHRKSKVRAYRLRPYLSPLVRALLGHSFLSTAPLITLDGSPQIVGQFKNITDLPKAAEELAAANDALEMLAWFDGLT